jgi:hypothetical protein
MYPYDYTFLMIVNQDVYCYWGTMISPECGYDRSYCYWGI